MGAFSEYFKSQPATEPTAAPPGEEGLGDTFTKSVSSGLRNAGASLNQLAGLGAEAVGANDFARGRYDTARTLRQAASEMAPQNNTWDDVHDAKSLVRFGVGQLGEMAPVAGAAVGAGLLTGRPFTAGSIAMGVPAAGDIASRQQDDPQAAALPAPTRLRNAVLGGAAAGVVGNIGPGMFASKVAGAASAPVERSILGTMGHNVAESVGVNAAGSAAGEGISQYATNQEAPLDAGRIKDAAVTGGVMGLPFGVGGGAVDVARSRAGGVADAVSGAAKSVQDRLGDAKAAVEDTAAKVPVKVGSMWDDLGGLAQKGRDKLDDTIDRVANGQPLGDLEKFATATGDTLRNLVDTSNNETLQKAKEWGTQMAEDAGLTPERRQAAADALQNLSSQGGAAAVAAMKKTYDAGKVVADKISAFAQVAGAGLKYGAEQAKAAAKRSDDDSGFRQVFRDNIIPAVTPILKDVPGLFDRPADVQRMGDALRAVGEKMGNGPLDSDTIAKAIDAFGNKTVDVLGAVHGVLGKLTDGLDQTQAESFFKNLNEIDAIQKRTSSLHDTIAASLTDDAKQSTLSSDIPQLTKTLVAHARGELGARDANGLRTAQETLINTRMADLMKEHFGPKADFVSKAVEKEAKLGQGDHIEAAGPDAQPEAMDTIRKGRGPNNEPVMDPELFRANNEQGQNYAAQYMKDMQAKYPDHEVRFEKVEGSDTHGHVVAEKAANPEALSDADVQGMRLDTKKYANSPDRIDVGGMALDTKRIAKVMDGRLEYTAADEISRAHRLARMFNEGIARLQEQHGAFEVPDGAVIGQVGGQNMTFGDAKRLDKRTAQDKASDEQTQLVHEYRKQLAQATFTPEKLQEHNLERVDMKPDAIADLRKELKALEKKISEARDAELAGRPEADGTKQFDDEGRLTPEALQQDLESRGITERSKDEQIHQAQIGAGANREHVKSNMAGGAHSVSDRVSEPRNELTMTVQGWSRGAAGPAKKIAERAKVLLASYDSMGKADRRAFQLLVGKSPSEASGVVNNLARKYKDVIVAPGAKEAPPGGTGLLAKAIDKRQSYLDNPPADYTTETARSHVAWAEKQLERVRAEAKNAEGDRANDLSDLASSLVRLVKKGKDVLEGDESLKGFEGSTPDPKAVAAKKAAFLERAASGDESLIKELQASTDAKGLQRAAEALPPGKVSDVVNARLAELVKNPDTSYSLQTKHYSAEAATGPDNLATRAAVEAHITKVLGQSVKTEWTKLTHAGEFERMRLNDVIRMSVHALDPMSVANHESVHAFFAQLKDAGATDITKVLEKAAETPHAMAQMQEFFKNDPGVLAQLKDPEERAAYMYQIWASDPKAMQLGPQVKGVFGRIADFIRSTLGIWSNDQRALHIMDYFHSGEYAKNMGVPSAVREHLMGRGRNQVVDTAKSFAEPLTRVADAVMGTGGARVRDTGIPSLAHLADLIKRDATKEGGDQGFIPAARIEATKRRGALGEALAGYTPEQLREAMEGLQKGQKPASGEAQAAAAAIKGVLAETKAYMEKAGVKLGDLGKDYFPRVWDTHYISKHPQAFLDMLEPYVRSGEFKGDPKEFMNRLSSRDGAEFGIETRTPGMQFTKERSLAFIDPKDAAQFVSKDLYGTLNSYINQATRRAEWNRRLGDGKLESLFNRAKAEGAKPEDLALADQYLRGIDGTLGDNINPHARRIMGNMIVYQNVRLLPMAMFSMLIDPMGVMVRGGTMREAWSTFKRGMANIPESFGKAAKHDEASRLAELVGVVDSAALAATMGDVYTQGMVGGTAQKINNAFFKFNMVEGLNRSFRIGASEAAMSFMGRHAGGTASVHSRRWMAELGLQKGDIKAVQGGRIALTEVEGLTPEQVTRVHGAINQWVDGAMLRPDAADKPIWMNDPHFALISHLKQFVFAFQKVIIGRVVHELEHGNFTPAMALASYVPIMMAADYAKGMIMGGGDQPEWKKGWDMGDYIGSGVQRAGLLGVGQFGFDVAQNIHRGGAGLGAVAGPTLEQFADSVQMLGGHKQFGPFVLDALPANALYKESLGGESKADPMFAD